MKNRLIISDVDGVLLDWAGQFHAYMRSQGHQKAHNAPSYWQETYYPNLSPDETRKMIYHFNTSAWMMGLPPYIDAKSGVAKLVENGYKFHAITSMGDDDQYALMAREFNLEQIFGTDVFVDITATNMYDPDSKREALSEYKDSGLYWLEDKPENAELGAELGLKSLLLLHDHNQEYEPKENIECVSSWVQICDIILDTN